MAHPAGRAKRRQSKEATNKYFDDVDANRQKATKEQDEVGVPARPDADSLIGWKKLRSGEIGDLKQPDTDGKKREGSLPIPCRASVWAARRGLMAAWKSTSELGSRVDGGAPEI